MRWRLFVLTRGVFVCDLRRRLFTRNIAVKERAGRAVLRDGWPDRTTAARAVSFTKAHTFCHLAPRDAMRYIVTVEEQAVLPRSSFV